MKKVFLSLLLVAGLYSCTKEIEVERIVYREDTSITGGLRTQITSLQAQINNLTAQITTLQSENSGLVIQQTQAQNQISELSSQLSIANAENESVRDSLVAAQAALVESNSLLETATENYNTLNETTTEQIDALVEQIRNLTTQLAEAREDLEDLGEDLEDALNDNDNSSNLVSIYRNRINNLQDEIDELNSLITSLDPNGHRNDGWYVIELERQTWLNIEQGNRWGVGGYQTNTVAVFVSRGEIVASRLKRLNTFWEYSTFNNVTINVEEIDLEDMTITFSPDERYEAEEFDLTYRGFELQSALEVVVANRQMARQQAFERVSLISRYRGTWSVGEVVSLHSYSEDFDRDFDYVSFSDSEAVLLNREGSCLSPQEYSEDLEFTYRSNSNYAYNTYFFTQSTTSPHGPEAISIHIQGVWDDYFVYVNFSTPDGSVGYRLNRRTNYSICE